MKEVPQYIQQMSMGSMPLVKYSRAGASVTQGMSDQLYNLGQDIYAKDVEIQKIKAKNTLDAELNRMFKENQNDPAALKASADKFKTGFIKGIKSPDLAQQFELNYDTIAAPLIDKATTNKLNIQKQDHELAVRTAIDTAIENAANYVDGVSSNIPEHVMNAERALGGNSIAFDELVQARNADGTFMFSPAQQVAFGNQRQAEIERRIKEAQAQKEKMAKLLRSDPAAYGVLNNMGLRDIVEMQPDPMTASVIPKDTAKEMVYQLSRIQTADDVLQFSSAMKQQYGEYIGNAMRDLHAANLPPEYSSMVQLSSRNAAANGLEIELLLDVAKGGGEKALNKAYKDVHGATPSNEGEIDNAVAEEMNDTAAALYNEGYGFDNVNKEIGIISNIAKAYRIKNPSVSIDDAVKFARTHYDREYQTTEMNGAKFRVPSAYDPDIITERLQDHMSAKEIMVVDSNKRIAQEAGVNAKDRAIPVLLYDGSGVIMSEPTGEPLLDKSGKPLVFKFDDLITEKTPSEIKQERINKAFSKDK